MLTLYLWCGVFTLLYNIWCYRKEFKQLTDEKISEVKLDIQLDNSGFAKKFWKVWTVIVLIGNALWWVILVIVWPVFWIFELIYRNT